MKNIFPNPLKTLAMSGLAALSLSSASWAHDFWLSPETYMQESGGVVDVSVMIGHPKDRMLWPVAPHRIISLRSFGPDGVQDHQAAIADYAKSKTLPIRLESPGLHVLTVETTSALSELDAEKFNAYIEEEGLTPIKIDRVLQKTTDQSGTEIYSRRGKSLIQVGPMAEADPLYLTRPLGLTLEIVPTENPMRLSEGEPMTSTIYYRGVPVSGVTIGLIDLDSDDGILALEQTDAAGRVNFERPKAGSWMLHAVWSDPMEDTTRADYDTIFSSLSFQVD